MDKSNNRIIINNYSNLDDEEAMKRVLEIIKTGKISSSRKRYCLAVTYKDGICVENSQTKDEKHQSTIFLIRRRGV